ncbi:hypothetical protein EAI_12539 [Harpegnathos saltator]|uniref:Uncharacterized protein n=1 Tax=Harpegnathos saltator TaxID=610380 RepID=E2B6J5_HARSA|nr:hypothetical protein EAI_12539 [Harpegnathos saltator]
MNAVSRSPQPLQINRSKRTLLEKALEKARQGDKAPGKFLTEHQEWIRVTKLRSSFNRLYRNDIVPSRLVMEILDTKH